MSKEKHNEIYYDPHNEVICDKLRLEELIDKVSDLEAKLAESEELNKRLYNENESAEKILRMSSDEQTREIKRLQNELSAKVDYIHELVEVKDDYKQQLAEKEKMLERIMSGEYIPANISEKSLELSNQDKISFAVEQLEKVKTRIQEDFDYDDLMYWLNKQIKMLKEGK